MEIAPFSVRARTAALRRRAARLLLGDDLERPDGLCREAPEWLVLVVNNFCNLHCRMCDVGLGESPSVFFKHLVGEDRRNMSVELLQRILAQASRFRPRPRVGLAYTEPLIHPRIVELSEAVTRGGFFCAVTTNGYRLPELADALVDAGLDQLTVSVDGPRDVHDRVRGTSGSFDRIRRGLERLRERRRFRGARRPRVLISFTITDLGVGHLVDFANDVLAFGAAGINVSHPNFISSEMAAAHNRRHPELGVAPSNQGPMDLSALDAGLLWREIQEIKSWARAPGHPPVTVVPDLPTPDAVAGYYRRPSDFVGGRRCSDPWRMMMVKTDGTVIPAHGRCYDVPVGNVERQSLSEIWNAPRFRDFRVTLREAGGSLTACARCCGVIGKSVEPGS